jgi:uncharacterized RDD family membrane protein YckC
LDQSDEILQIDTPENVGFGYEIAGIGSRFMAAFVDTLIIVLIIFIVILTGIALLQVPDILSDDLGETASAWILAIFSLIIFVVLWGYYIAFELLWNGQTPGKRLFKLRVIRTSGTPVTVTDVLVRNLVRLVDFLPLSYGVGVVSMFVSKQSQRLGDLAAGTLVVWDQTEVSLESVRDRKITAPPLIPQPAVTNTSETPEPDSSLPVERLNAQDVQMIQEFLSRRFQLSNAAAMGRQIYMRTRSRMGLPQADIPGTSHAQWLSSVLTEYHAKRK